MKAIVQSDYGSPDVLEFMDIDKPVVKDDEVLVRVRAAAVNPPDWAGVHGGAVRCPAHRPPALRDAGGIRPGQKS